MQKFFAKARSFAFQKEAGFACVIVDIARARRCCGALETVLPANVVPVLNYTLAEKDPKQTGGTCLHEDTQASGTYEQRDSSEYLEQYT